MTLWFYARTSTVLAKREHEIVGRVVVPLGVVSRALQRIERAVDLDRRQHPRRVFQLAVLRQLVGIEHVAPRLVAPAGDADADAACHACTRSSELSCECVGDDLAAGRP